MIVDVCKNVATMHIDRLRIIVAICVLQHDNIYWCFCILFKDSIFKRATVYVSGNYIYNLFSKFNCSSFKTLFTKLPKILNETLRVIFFDAHK